jgi:hypothetical protein
MDGNGYTASYTPDVDGKGGTLSYTYTAVVPPDGVTEVGATYDTQWRAMNEDEGAMPPTVTLTYSGGSPEVP